MRRGAVPKIEHWVWWVCEEPAPALPCCNLSPPVVVYPEKVFSGILARLKWFYNQEEDENLMVFFQIWGPGSCGRA